jgi:hypothetical protein
MGASTMPNEQADKNGGPPLPPTNRVVVAEIVTDDSLLEDARLAEQSAEAREARAREWDKTVSKLATIRDETDTDEAWSEILRKLGGQFGGSR